MSSVEDRFNELEARIETLEDALALAEPSKMLGVDRYDSAVLDRLAESRRPVSVSQLHTWYRRAGVRNEQKIKNRLRDLRADDLIEQVGTANWEYSGPRQERLGEVNPE